MPELSTIETTPQPEPTRLQRIEDRLERALAKRARLAELIATVDTEIEQLEDARATEQERLAHAAESPPSEA